ncbi:MAG: peptidylprolyl isomerase [Prevotellaceae bacterium]|jgi:cyclophilin family peptidyl-prolyl cis-trans isomerase|nr:peptidylprolyl isomerase [Prevotellaceae bacterium]
MKKKLLSISIIVAIFFACNNGKKTEQQSQQTEQTEQPEVVNEKVTEQAEEKSSDEQTQQTETKVMTQEKQETQEKPKVKKSDDPVFDIVTTLGTIRIKLYKETPKHRDNFISLATSGYYDGVLFHRVIKDFMIQTGDPDSKNAKPIVQLGMGGPDYKIDAEILPQFKHKKGAVAAARQGDQVNPEKKSSGSQFYIVHNQNGTPFLDGSYTVFGETISGLDVVDKIANVKTGQGDRPIEDVKIEKIVRVE